MPIYNCINFFGTNWLIIESFSNHIVMPWPKMLSLVLKENYYKESTRIFMTNFPIHFLCLAAGSIPMTKSIDINSLHTFIVLLCSFSVICYCYVTKNGEYKKCNEIHKWQKGLRANLHEEPESSCPNVYLCTSYAPGQLTDEEFLIERWTISSSCL